MGKWEYICGLISREIIMMDNKDNIMSEGGQGLVLEGGGMRGMFTCGVLDVFMERGITFDGMTGVSAGVLFGCNYKSRQPGRALRYNLKYRNDDDYMSWKSWRQTGDYVNTEFSYHKLPYELDPMDFEAFAGNPMKMYAVCTDIGCGHPVYKLIDDARGEGLTWMRASGALPIFANAVTIDGKDYMDGGLSDSIPLKFMQEMGYRKNVVVLTQPQRFRKTKSHLYWPLRLAVRKYPEVARLMRVRHTMYNSQLDYVARQVGLGNTFVIQPDEKLHIGRLETDAGKMKRVYEAGRRKAMEVMAELTEFLGEEV